VRPRDSTAHLTLTTRHITLNNLWHQGNRSFTFLNYSNLDNTIVKA